MQKGILLACFYLFPLALWGQSSTFPCEIVITKAPCWKSREVTITAQDFLKRKKIATYVLKKGQLTLTKSIKCYPNQQLAFLTQFSPPVWQNEANKIYPGTHIWRVPPSLQSLQILLKRSLGKRAPTADKWIIPICFATDFIRVPIPFEVQDLTQCQCKTSG